MIDPSRVSDLANAVFGNSTTGPSTASPHHHNTSSKLDTFYIFLFLAAAAIAIVGAPVAFQKCKEYFRLRRQEVSGNSSLSTLLQEP